MLDRRYFFIPIHDKKQRPAIGNVIKIRGSRLLEREALIFFAKNLRNSLT